MDEELEGTGANVPVDTIITALIFNNPTESTKHLIDGSGAQFSDSLYGTGRNNPNDTGGEQFCQPTAKQKRGGAGSSSSSSSKRKETLEEKKCDMCHKDCQKPSNLMLAKLQKCIAAMKTSGFASSPRHFERNPFLCSSDLEEHLVNQDVLTWMPHLIYWNSTIRCWVNGCGGSLKMAKISHRSVEAMDGVKFILSAQYLCENCGRYKTSLDLDAMAQSGFPLAVLALCPVVPFKKSSVEKGTYELMITLCSSGTPFEAFGKMVESTRFGVYTKTASRFLQMQAIKNTGVQPLKATTGLGSSGVAILGSSQPLVAFPEFYSHCNGWGGGKGPTPVQWGLIFMDGTKSLKLMSKGVEGSIGGVSMSHDLTFDSASRILVTIPVDQGGPMVAPVVSLESVIYPPLTMSSNCSAGIDVIHQGGKSFGYGWICITY